MAMLDEIDGVERVVADCTLDKSTQSLVKMIFDNDMFKEAMKQMDIGELKPSCVHNGLTRLSTIMYRFFSFYLSAIKAVGYSDHQRRVVWRAGGQKFSSY